MHNIALNWCPNMHSDDLEVKKDDDSPASSSIKRVSAVNLSRTLFDNEYWGREPIIISDVVSSWKAYGRWNPGYLRRTVRSNPTSVHYNEKGIFDLGAGKTYLLPFGQCVDLIESAQGHMYYIQQRSLLMDFPDLLADIDLPYLLDGGKRLQVINLWFGGRGCKSPLHHDRSDNFLAQVYGSKHVILYSPRNTRGLYPFRESFRSHCSQVNVFEPDDETFPLYSSVKALRKAFRLNAGEMLYIPSRWWHAVDSLEVSISVNFWWNQVQRK